MPYAAKKPCAHSGCRALVQSGSGSLCALHRTEKTRLYNQQPERAKAKSLYATKQWQDIRRLVLRSSPLCVVCKKAGRFVAAEHVDHIKPHKGDEATFFDVENLQSLCKPCHSRKTVTEDGGFGNPQKLGGQSC